MSGFTKIDNEVIRRGSEVGSTAIHVYLVLAMHVNESRTCWPSIERIASLAGCSESTVRRAIKALKNVGLLEVDTMQDEHGVSMANHYHLPPVGYPVMDDTLPCHGCKGEGVTGAQNHPVTGDTQTRLIKNKTNRTRRGKAASGVLIPENLNNESFKVVWEVWLDYRSEKKKPVSERAAKIQLQDLAAMGPDQAIQTIRKSIKNDWQGLFEPGGNGKPATDAKPVAPIRYFETSKK